MNEDLKGKSLADVLEAFEKGPVVQLNLGAQSRNPSSGHDISICCCPGRREK